MTAEIATPPKGFAVSGSALKKAKKSKLVENGVNGANAEGLPAQRDVKRPRRKRRDRQADGTPALGDTGVPAPEGDLPRRKRRSRPPGDPNETEEGAELKRRQRQRELRDIALKQRAEGKAYQRPREKPLDQIKTGKGKAARGNFATRGKFAPRNDDAGNRPKHAVEVIVVPIFWNTRPDEKAEVLKAASQALSLLEGAQIKTGMDTSDSMTPGQKFAHWEHKGVMVRLECGPRDAANQQCVLAVSKTAGQVAVKQTFKIGPDLLQAIGKAMGKTLGISSLQPPLAGTATSKDAVQMIQPAQQKLLSVLGSGDELAGDFQEADRPDEEASKSRKKHKKKGAI